MTIVPPPVAPAPSGRRGPWLGLVVHGAVLLAVGVAVGLLWAVLEPFASRHSDGIEATLSGEVTLALLGLAAGVVIAAVGLVRPGEPPLPHAVTRLAGSVLASGVSWGVGLLAGAPALAGPGVVLIWPLTVALVTALGTLVQVVLHEEA